MSYFCPEIPGWLAGWLARGVSPPTNKPRLGPCSGKGQDRRGAGSGRPEGRVRDLGAIQEMERVREKERHCPVPLPTGRGDLHTGDECFDISLDPLPRAEHLAWCQGLALARISSGGDPALSRFVPSSRGITRQELLQPLDEVGNCSGGLGFKSIHLLSLEQLIHTGTI